MSVSFGWPAIVRLGLVQLALGSIVVLATSTLNRVMVVELALPALLPGVLLALHYAVQVCRPRVGHGSDRSGRRTPWIVGGMVLLAGGGWLAAVATAWMHSQRLYGVLLALLAFVLIGLGVAAAGTSLLALLASRVAAERRAAAATTVWLMMILGFVITAGVSGALLDPYSPARLVAVSGGVALLAVLLTVLAMWGLEGQKGAPAPALAHPPAALPFRAALREAWQEPAARQFTVFVFVAMLAYSAQDLILEPFAGAVFGLSPGASTQLAGVQHGGALLGMLAAALAGRRGWGSLRAWVIGGCAASALALLGLAAAGLLGAAWPLRANVFLLGVTTGAFSIAAIASMMRLAGADGGGREGLRMGLWGAAQALAFALGGLVGTAASDLARLLLADVGHAYAAVFAGEALLFLLAAQLAAGVAARPQASRQELLHAH